MPQNLRVGVWHCIGDEDLVTGVLKCVVEAQCVVGLLSLRIELVDLLSVVGGAILTVATSFLFPASLAIF